MARPFDPQRFEVATFAESALQESGEFPVAGMGRLLDDNTSPTSPDNDGVVTWTVRGESRERPGSEPLVWLHLKAMANVTRTCQRCLEPVLLPLTVDTRLRFVRGEDKAARLDAETEEDVLALEPTLDLHALIEDELVLALPVIPMHEQCRAPVDASATPEDAQALRANPFAVLQNLKKTPKTH